MSNPTNERVIVLVETGGDTGCGEITTFDDNLPGAPHVEVVHIDWDNAAQDAGYARQKLADAAEWLPPEELWRVAYSLATTWRP